MIHSIAVACGSAIPARAAQQHAIAIAGQFGARLRVIVAWNHDDLQRLPADCVEPTPEHMADRDVEEIRDTAREQGVVITEQYHGEGLKEGLLAEARAADLLVVGMPADVRSGVTRQDETLVKAEVEAIRHAESSLLIVSTPWVRTRHILATYRGGLEGKHCLRWAGALAETTGAALTVAVFSRVPQEITMRASVAESYLESFDISDLEVIERDCDGREQADIAAAVSDAGADFVVLGADQYGLFARLLGADTAEDVALHSTCPVMVVR